MKFQEIVNSIDDLSIEERDYLFDLLRQRREQQQGDTFWQNLQDFRKRMEQEQVTFDDEDFRELRDRSPGREVIL